MLAQVLEERKEKQAQKPTKFWLIQNKFEMMKSGQKSWHIKRLRRILPESSDWSHKIKGCFVNGWSRNKKTSSRYGPNTKPVIFPLSVWPPGHTRAAETRLGPRFRGLGVARWPHQGGKASGLTSIPYLLLVFSFLLQPLTKQALILKLQSLDSGRIFLNPLICQDLAQISSLRIYSELIQNLVGFWLVSLFFH